MNSHSLQPGTQNGLVTLEDSLDSLKKIYDPTLELLGIYANKLKLKSAQKPTYKFIAALFTTAKTWKQPRCSSVG